MLMKKGELKFVIIYEILQMSSTHFRLNEIKL